MRFFCFGTRYDNDGSKKDNVGFMSLLIIMFLILAIFKLIEVSLAWYLQSAIFNHHISEN